MPKVEPSDLYPVPGGFLVHLSDLDRANAQIERLESQAANTRAHELEEALKTVRLRIARFIDIMEAFGTNKIKTRGDAFNCFIDEMVKMLDSGEMADMRRLIEGK